MLQQQPYHFEEGSYQTLSICLYKRQHSLAEAIYEDAEEEDAVATGKIVSCIHIWELTWEPFHFFNRWQLTELRH